MLERVAGESAWQVAEQKEILDPEAQIDKASELQKKWGTERGQLWQIGPHRLVCGDCRDEGTVGRLWADGGPKLRMVWTDPPYGVDYGHKNSRLNLRDSGHRIEKDIRGDIEKRQAPTVFATGLAQAAERAEVGAACYVTVPGGSALPSFIAAFKSSGFAFHTTCSRFQRRDGEPLRVTSIFSLWASNSVPMPAIGERNVRAEAADIASDAKGTSSFQWEKAFCASIAF